MHRHVQADTYHTLLPTAPTRWELSCLRETSSMMIKGLRSQEGNGGKALHQRGYPTKRSHCLTPIYQSLPSQ